MTPMADMSASVPQPPQPPMQPTMQTAPTLETGGTTDTSWKGWAKSANWVEIGFMVLGTAATEREQIQKLQLKTDEMTAEIAGLKTPKKSQSRF
jgi:hypothetical protein